MKKILSVLLVLSLVLSFTACSKLSGKDDDSDTRNTNECIKDIPDKNESALKNGKILYFGAYPKEEVWLDWLKDMLNETLESDYDESEWKTYSFYEGDSNTDHTSSRLEYIDVVISGHKYRGARITRHNFVDINEETEEDYSDYSIHWFYYTPLEWQIVDEKNGVIICNDIIDYKSYADEFEVTYMASDWKKDDGTPASDWETSYIKNWLTGDFYEEAFMRSGNGSAEYYKPLIDKDSITILSEADVKKYTFDTCAEPTVYSDFLGVEYDSMNDATATWMLKDTYDTNCVAYYDNNNKINIYNYENICKPIGIRPMMTVTDLSVFDEATLTKDQIDGLYDLHTICFGRDSYNSKSADATEWFWSALIPFCGNINRKYDLGYEYIEEGNVDPLNKFSDEFGDKGKFDAERIDKIIKHYCCTEPNHEIETEHFYYYDGSYYFATNFGGGGPYGEYLEYYTLEEDGTYRVSVYDYMFDTSYEYVVKIVDDIGLGIWAIQSLEVTENYYEDLFVF